MMFGAGATTTPKKVSRETVRRVIAYFQPYKGQVVLTFITVIIAVLVGLLPPWFLQIIIDKGFGAKDLSVIARFSVYTIFATIVGAALTLLYGYWNVIVGQKI